MFRIKIDATESTNDHLKQLLRDKGLQDGTVLRTLNQTKGRGQRGANWHFEEGKSLAISILKKWEKTFEPEPWALQCVISLAVFSILSEFGQAKWQIKWPNDIMADRRKICGILIEHQHQGYRYATIVGLGVNVNNASISSLPQAGSIAGVLGHQTDLEVLDQRLSQAVYQAMVNFDPEMAQAQLDAYNAELYLRGVQAQFEQSDGTRIQGDIQKVDHQGQLLILSQGVEHRFKVGEIKYLSTP